MQRAVQAIAPLTQAVDTLSQYGRLNRERQQAALTDPNIYDNVRTDPLAPDPTAGYSIARPEGNLRSGVTGGLSTLGGVLNEQSSELARVQGFVGDVANAAFPLNKEIGDRLPYVPTPGGLA